MGKNIIQIVLGIIGLLALYSGLFDKKVLFINDIRTAVIVLFAVGFIMCSIGRLEIFITNSPAHFLSIAAYALGALALFTGIIQIFNIKFPYLSEPKTAITVIAAVIILKVIISRFSFLLTKSS